MFRWPEEELRQTINVQPAVLATSVACLKAAQEASNNGLPAPTFVAGHDVGTYTALVAADAISLSDAMRLIRERGRLMNEAGQRTAGGMVSMSGLDIETFKNICFSTGAEIAYIDAPDQITISGYPRKPDQSQKTSTDKGRPPHYPSKGKRALQFHTDGAGPGKNEKCHFRVHV